MLQPGSSWQDIQAHLKDGVVLCKLAAFIFVVHSCN